MAPRVIRVSWLRPSLDSSEEPVRDGERVRHREAPPLLCDRPIHREDPLGVLLGELGEPELEGDRRARIAVAAVHARTERDQLAGGGGAAGALPCWSTLW